MTCFNQKWIWLRKAYPIEKPQYEETLHWLNKPLWHKTKQHYAKLIPCHECLGCKLDHASEWAVRAYMEFKTSDTGCFITLTYNDGYRTIKGSENELSLPLTEKGQEIYNKYSKSLGHNDTMKLIEKLQRHKPEYMTLKKEDMQKFWKRLRKKYPDIKIKYIQSGEIGPKGHRPHYHAVCFGYKPTDLEYYKTNHCGQIVYKSKELAKIWGCGFVTIGELNYKTACYTARYTQKKLIQEHKKEHKNHFLEEEKQKYDIILDKKRNMEDIIKITEEQNKIRGYETNKDSILATFTKYNTRKKILKEKNDIQDEYIVSSQKIGLNYWIINKKLIKSQYGVNVVIDKKPTLKKIPTYFLKKWNEENWEEFEKAKYENQIKGEKRYWEKINQLNYPQKTPEWQKEIIFKQNQLFKLNHALERLHRNNINSKNYYST